MTMMTMMIQNAEDISVIMIRSERLLDQQLTSNMNRINNVLGPNGLTSNGVVGPLNLGLSLSLGDIYRERRYLVGVINLNVSV